jgi:2-oxoglutarate ferredoxin oxidoreductase subunit delta
MKGKIKIYKELCKGCTFCIESCPLGVIVIGKRFNKQGFFPAVAVQMEKCTGCSICAQMCPEIAIEVFRNNNKKPATAKKKTKKKK